MGGQFTWQTATPESRQLSTEKLDRLRDQLAAKDSYVQLADVIR